MTDRHRADPKLIEAFRALSDSPEAACSEETRQRIWQAVTGELPPAERRKVVEMTAADPACAEAWRIAVELWRAAGPSAGAAAAPAGAAARPIMKRFWTPTWLAAAAAVLLTTTLGTVWLLNRPPADVYRATRDYVIQPLVPADTRLPRNAFRLRWTPGPAGSRYEVRITTEDLQMLETISDLTVPELLIPQDQLANVTPASRVLWQVEALLPDGDRVTSPTFIARVE